MQHMIFRPLDPWTVAKALRMSGLNVPARWLESVTSECRFVRGGEA